MGGGTDIIEMACAESRAAPAVAARAGAHAEQPTVLRVADEPVGLTAVGLSALLGIGAAGLAVALVERWMPGGAWISGLFAMGVLAWLLAAWWLCHGAGRPLVVLRRGCLLGLVQWIALASQHEPVALARSGGRGGGEPAPVALLDGWITQALAVDMVWLCLAGLIGLSWLTWATRHPTAR